MGKPQIHTLLKLRSPKRSKDQSWKLYILWEIMSCVPCFFFFAMFRQPYLVNLSKQFLDSSDATSRTRLLAVLVLKHGSHNDVSAPLYYYASNVLLFDGNHFSPDYHSHQFGVRCNIRLSLCHFSCLRSISACKYSLMAALMTRMYTTYMVLSV